MLNARLLWNGDDSVLVTRSRHESERCTVTPQDHHTLFAGGGDGPGGISEPGPAPAAMPVCRTLLPVVDAAGIQVEKDKFRCEIEDYTGTASNFSVVPTEALPSPLRDLARYGEFVYDNGHSETDRGTLYPEDYILTTLSS